MTVQPSPATPLGRRPGLGTRVAALAFLVCGLVDTSFGGGLYLNQLALSTLIGGAAIYGLAAGRTVAWALIGALSVIGLSFVSAGATTTPNPAYLEESAKILLIVLGAWSLSRAPSLLVALRAYLPVLCLLTVIWTLVAGTWNYYDPILPRFGVPQWGSPNSTSIVLGSALLVHFGRAPTGAHLLNRIRGVAAGIFVAAGLSVALVATMSRGGILAFTFALLVRTRRRLRYFVPLLGFLAVGYVGLVQSGVPRADVIAELTESGGSGRASMWRELLGDVVASPVSFVLGRGPGSVDLQRGSGRVVSAHSSFVTVVYFFGLVGTVLVALALLNMAKRVLSAGAEFRERLGWPLYAFLVVSGLFDYYAGAAQLGWLFAFLFAILWASDPGERARTAVVIARPATSSPVGHLA